MTDPADLSTLLARSYEMADKDSPWRALIDVALAADGIVVFDEHREDIADPRQTRCWCCGPPWPCQTRRLGDALTRLTKVMEGKGWASAVTCASAAKRQ